MFGIKSFLGIKFTKSPVLAYTLILAIVAVQLINRFVYDGKKEQFRERFENYESLQEAARNNGFGFTDPFFQIAAADMFKDRQWTTKNVISTIIYYFFLLSGLVLSESVLGHFNMILLVIVGVMVSYLTNAMSTISCVLGQNKGLVGGHYCCGEYFGWFMSGVTMAVLFNYHFLKTKKVSSLIFGLFFLLFGFGILMYQRYYIMDKLTESKYFDNGSKWCLQSTTSVVPYMLGGMTTMGMMGLLFTKA